MVQAKTRDTTTAHVQNLNKRDDDASDRMHAMTAATSAAVQEGGSGDNRIECVVFSEPEAENTADFEGRVPSGCTDSDVQSAAAHCVPAGSPTFLRRHEYPPRPALASGSGEARRPGSLPDSCS